MNLLRCFLSRRASPLLCITLAALFVVSGCSTPPQAQPAQATAHPVSSIEALEQPHAAHTATTGDRFLYADAPVPAGYPNSWTVLTNIGYESAYDETYKNPAWVAYHLTGATQTVQPRPSGYPTDTRTVSKVDAADYPSGYDHGHMAPNYSIAQYFGDAAQGETFFMSNMLPQRPGLNRGPWKAVESAEYTSWTPAYHDVWVICGPIYTLSANESVNPSNRYGPKQICIPVACFKVVLAKGAGGELKTLAFIMPQENVSGHRPAEFLKSIREIERRTGLNFFSSLSQAQQDEIETKVATQLWP